MIVELSDGLFPHARRFERVGGFSNPPYLEISRKVVDPTTCGVVDASTGMRYRGQGPTLEEQATHAPAVGVSASHQLRSSAHLVGRCSATKGKRAFPYRMEGCVGRTQRDGL